MDFVAHPTFVEEAELACITGPLSIAAAEIDDTLSAEKRHRSEETLAKSDLPYQVSLYSGVVHRFTVHCDVSKSVQRYAMEQAFI